MAKRAPTSAVVAVAGRSESTLRSQVVADLRMAALKIDVVEVAKRSDLLSRQEQVKALVIVWDREALSSLRLYEIARLSDHLTLHVIAPDLSIEDLPVGIKPGDHHLVYAGEAGRLLNAVSSALDPPMFSMGRSPRGPMQSRAYSRPELSDEQRRSIESVTAKLIYAIPTRMFLREPEEIEVRIGSEQARGLLSDISGREAPVFESTASVEVMGVRLRAGPNDFAIEDRSPHKQLVGGAMVEALGREQLEFGQWFFHVTPLRTGQRAIHIDISGEVDIGDGRRAMRNISPKDYVVEVRISNKRVLRGIGRVALWLILLAFTSVVGAATQELWWPKLSELFGWR